MFCCLYPTLPDIIEHCALPHVFNADYICCLYGTPSAYGVVTMPFSVREGINIFLAGFVPTENLRFRDEELNFKLSVAPGTILYTLSYDATIPLL